MPYDLLVWAAGVVVPDLAAYRGLALTPSGRLAVTPTLQLLGHPEAFAIGDLAGAGSGRELP